MQDKINSDNLKPFHKDVYTMSLGFGFKFKVSLGATIKGNLYLNSGFSYTLGEVTFSTIKSTLESNAKKLNFYNRLNASYNETESANTEETAFLSLTKGR